METAVLATSLLNASSGLGTISRQIDLVSRNISRAGDADASAKVAALVTDLNGGVAVGRIDRTGNKTLLEAALSATSGSAAQKVTDDALSQLQAVIGQVSDQRSPAALIAKLADALQIYSANPADGSSAAAVVDSAKGIANGLNQASIAIAGVRAEADSQISAAVATVNGLLSQFEVVNKQVVLGTSEGRDVTSEQDQRDGLLKSLAENVGVHAVLRNNNDMALYTDSGVTMFDGVPRKIAMSQTPLAPGLSGGDLNIDGVPVAGPGQTMALESGKLRALVDVRDVISAAASAQIDEIARGLVTAFAETPNSAAPGLSAVPGLFTAQGVTVIPQAGIRVVGLASSIAVNVAYDPANGGNPRFVRDGGSAGAAYASSTAGQAGDASRILALIDSVGATRSFDPSADLGATADLLSFSAASVASLAQLRKDSTSALDYKSAVLSRATDALSNETGISLDQEMSHMLGLERSYQASSRLLTAIDGMFKVLLGAAA